MQVFLQWLSDPHFRRNHHLIINSVSLFAIHFLALYFDDTNIRTVAALASTPSRSYKTSGRVAPFGKPAFPTRESTATMGPPKATSRCSCGSVSVEFPITSSSGDEFPVIDCHCPSCRRYHVTSFVRYLEIPENDVQVIGDSAVRFQDSCSQLGQVLRTYCRRCYSKLLTSRIGSSTIGNTALVNMGPIDEATVPAQVLEKWRTATIIQWRPDLAPAWTWGVPQYVLEQKAQSKPSPPSTFKQSYMPGASTPPSSVSVTGGCTCGACQYRFQVFHPTEMQHCYCSLCRQLSGGPMMTWVPVLTKPQKFGWSIQSSVTKFNSGTPQRASAPEQPRQATVSTSEIPLVRYTDHGQRHVCAHCGGVLSIIYDSDNYDDEEHGTIIWLAAGSFDSIRFPTSHVERYLDRVVHICCRSIPKWYTLPNDGMPRIEDAS